MDSINFFNFSIFTPQVEHFCIPRHRQQFKQSGKRFTLAFSNPCKAFCLSFQHLSSPTSNHNLNRRLRLEAPVLLECNSILPIARYEFQSDHTIIHHSAAGERVAMSFLANQH